MSDDLRAPLIRHFETLATDVAIGRHGDPHVAFVVLVYPDREPAILAVTPSRSPRDLKSAEIAETIRERWQRRKEAPMQRALVKAADELDHPHVCECKRRFATERGLKMHQARSHRLAAAPSVRGEGT